MELFLDKANMQSLIATIWTALRTLDGTIKPWQPGENAFEVNPQLKDATHHIYNCLPAFWKSTFENRAPPTAPFAWSREDWQVWCRAHGRIEQVNYAYAKLFALATGMFSFEQWIDLVPNNTKKVVDNQQPWREMHASHRCGNGQDGCIGLMCILFELTRSNMYRGVCHTYAAAHPDEDPPCICDAGKTSGQKCIMDRPHLDFQAMKTNFNEIFESTSASEYLSACPVCLDHVIGVHTLVLCQREGQTTPNNRSLKTEGGSDSKSQLVSIDLTSDNASPDRAHTASSGPLLSSVSNTRSKIASSSLPDTTKALLHSSNIGILSEAGPSSRETTASTASTASAPSA